MNTVRSQSLPPSESSSLPSANQQKSIPNQAPPVAIVPPTPQRTLPSLQITLRNDENERNVSSTINIPKTMTASAKPTNERASREQKHSFQSSTTILVGGGSRSAFRPFHKPTAFNPQQRVPSNTSSRVQISTDQIQQ
ncbi:unnamed protein product, partial [Rotaria sp. Silwood2]